MHYPNSDAFYSWKNNDGTDGIFKGDNVQDGKWSGYWRRYELPEVKYACTLSDLSVGIGKAFSGVLIGGAGSLILASAGTAAELGYIGIAIGQYILKAKVNERFSSEFAEVATGILGSTISVETKENKEKK